MLFHFLQRIYDRLLSIIDTSSLWQLYTRQCKGFTCSSGFVTVAGTDEVDFLLIKNPDNSGERVAFQEFIMTIHGTSAQSTLWRFYRNPTVTNMGTQIPVQKVLSTCTNETTIEFWQSPTISNRGTFIQMFNTDFITYERRQELSRFLTPGNTILATVEGSATNIEHNFNTAFAKEDI